jgi:hypothetical protein
VKRIIRRPLHVAWIGALLIATCIVPTSAAGRDDTRPRDERPIVKTRRIAPGLKYTKIIERGIPRRTFILTMDPAKAVTLDVTLAESDLPANRELTRIVSQHGALAGINGDFNGQPVGNPVHVLMQDGELLHTTAQLGALFALSQDETQTFFGKPTVRITMTDPASNVSYRVDRWNQGPPMPGELAGFTPLGGTLMMPPEFSCSARLLPTAPLQLAQEDGVVRDFEVDEVGCSEDAIPRNGGVVVSAAPATDEAVQLLTLTPGTPIRLHWSLGWPGVLDAVGGVPHMVQDGQIVGTCNSGCGPQPRTGVGVTAGGRILMVVVDGRQPRWSVGPTLIEFARIMRDLGAVNALNLDGGGSSEMVVDGEIVNRPSDGRERRLSNAILVLPSADPGEG